MTRQVRILILSIFSLLFIGSIYYSTQLRFTFDFEQFFPKGDKDLIFFKQFIQDFESDDNFMLVAVEKKEGVFDSTFLTKFHDFSLKARNLPYVVESQSLTQFSYPIKTPFGITTRPAIRIQKPELYEKDKKRLLSDERFVYNLISEDATALVLSIKTINSIELPQATKFMAALDNLIAPYGFEDYHYLGRPYFQTEIVRMQKREILVSSAIAAIMVLIILFLIFRRWRGVLIAIVSIGLGMLLFGGFLGVSGRELNAMSALYPILMIIVGTSDVIHIMSKYVDELKKGESPDAAIRTTIRDIGLATLLTSITTAIGFASLMSGRIEPIQDFGINAAIGVTIAYITVIFFTTALLSMCTAEQLIRSKEGHAFWQYWMNKTHFFVRARPKAIILGTMATIIGCLLGIAMISTNYKIKSNLPIGEKISSDFLFYENLFAGFRPLEWAVFAEKGYLATDYEVLKEIDKVEQHLKSIAEIKSVSSITALYKSIHQMYNSNKVEAYHLPKNKVKYQQQKKWKNKIPSNNISILLSKDGQKARISSRVKDLGAERVLQLGADIDHWIANNTDSSIATFRRTGTGLILDKNAIYIRKNLLFGIAGAVLIVSLLMGLFFRNWQIVLVALLPNAIPLLVAGAILGYFGIELEAGIAIVFSIVFGIAVDDSIHFLSKFKLSFDKDGDVEKAIQTTFLETGKAICLTSIILFFGFMIMLFSIHPPSKTVGWLISLTLFSALLNDLLLLPVLLRAIIKNKKKTLERTPTSN